jgi:hypothetical protein
LEKETTSRQAKNPTVSISKEAGASLCEKGGPALPELGRQHAYRERERPITPIRAVISGVRDRFPTAQPFCDQLACVINGVSGIFSEIALRSPAQQRNTGS